MSCKRIGKQPNATSWCIPQIALRSRLANDAYIALCHNVPAASEGAAAAAAKKQP
jgi:hypothetical protein